MKQRRERKPRKKDKGEKEKGECWGMCRRQS